MYFINKVPIIFDKIKIHDKVNQVIAENNKAVIFTINSNIIVNTYLNPYYLETIRNSYFNICDGSVLANAISFIHKNKVHSYPGPDFFIDIISMKKYTHAFIGSSKETLEGLKLELKKYDPKINNYLFLELPFTSVEKFNYDEISNKINNINPDFIWISLGAPKQELFSNNLIDRINRGNLIAVGAAFDFYSGNSTSRCPKIIRKIYLEWLFRLIKQPEKTFNRLKKELLYMPIILVKEYFKK
jgi:N-acetylglucosaminyldiphosphoundecaprenol N-acetyl-beta-D-mannosaminyltransferase